MCTARTEICAHFDDEVGYEAVKLSARKINDLLACITICNTLNPKVAAPPLLAIEPEMSYQDVVNAMNQHRGSLTVRVDKMQCFVRVLQALMFQCLRDEPQEMMCVLIVDPDFSRPKEWSFRWPWKVEALHADGLSIMDMDRLAEEYGELCDIEID